MYTSAVQKYTYVPCKVFYCASSCYRITTYNKIIAPFVNYHSEPRFQRPHITILVERLIKRLIIIYKHYPYSFNTRNHLQEKLLHIEQFASSPWQFVLVYPRSTIYMLCRWREWKKKKSQSRNTSLQDVWWAVNYKGDKEGGTAKAVQRRDCSSDRWVKDKRESNTKLEAM